jgi:hypothetical protein
MKKITTVLFAFGLFFAQAGEVMAEEDEHGHGGHMTETTAGDSDEVKISGYLSTAYENIPNHDASSFALEQVEVDFEKNIGDTAGLRIDINHLNEEEVNGDNVMEQGYAWVNLGPAKFTFGKFNAPIGFELLDKNEMFQATHAMVFDYGIPTNLVGAMISGEAGMIDYSLYVVNGWDNNGDDNTDKTIGGRIGITPNEMLNVGISYITGKENVSGSSAPAEGGHGEGEPAAGGAELVSAESGSTPTANLSVVDIDFTINLGEHTFVGGEYNIGTFEGESLVTHGDDATWTAFLIMIRHHYHNGAGITLRYEQFHDTEGARFGNGVDETRTSYTISPSYEIAEGFEALLEYRYTKSDSDTFHDSDGNAKDNQSSFIAEMVYSF